MSTMVNNLFPPQVETFQSAFIYNTDPVVEFSIPSFNELKAINYLQVTVVDQKNNQNALRGSDKDLWDEQYNCGLVNGIFIIKFPDSKEGIPSNSLIQYDRSTNIWKVKIPVYYLRQDETIEIDNKKYHNIKSGSDKNSNPNADFVKTRYFNVGQYYKVQLRFDGYPKITESGVVQNLRTWSNTIKVANQNKEILTEVTVKNVNSAYQKYFGYLVNNRIYFSEWSEVTLIKPILHANFRFPQLESSVINIDKNELAVLNQEINGITASITMRDELFYHKDLERKTEQTGESNLESESGFFPEDLDYVQGLRDEDEYVETYRITVHPMQWNGAQKITNYEVINYQSDWEYTTSIELADGPKNIYDYGINTYIELKDTDVGQFHTLVVEYRTNNNYYGTVQRYFQTSKPEERIKEPYWHNGKNPNFAEEPGHIEVNQEDGIVKIRLRWNVYNASESVDYVMSEGVLYIKRASSLDNFKEWKLISCTYHTQDEIEKADHCVSVDIDDYTVGSLITYQYSAQYHCMKAYPKDPNEIVPAIWTRVFYSNTVYMKFYDMLLERQGRQVAIRYNGQITNWKPVVNRQKVDTLGGRYPKFVENAQMNYKQFSINGLISAESDFNRTFLNEYGGEFYKVVINEGDIDSGKQKWVYRNKKFIMVDDSDIKEGEQVYYYRTFYRTDMKNYDLVMDGKYMVRNDTDADGEYGYNPQTRVNEYNLHGGLPPYPIEDLEDPSKYNRTIFTDIESEDYSHYFMHDMYPTDNWYWERTFREELIKWLNDGEPKLYRSMPEGNLSVILTDLSLSPNQQLGRRLYNFSATLYEVGDGYDLDVLDSLGIYTIPKLTNKYGEILIDPTEEGDIDIPDHFQSSHLDIGQLWLPNRYLTDLIHGPDGTFDAEETKLSKYIWNDKTIRELLEYKYRGAYGGEHVLQDTIAVPWIRLQFISPGKYYISQRDHDGAANWLQVNADSPTVLTEQYYPTYNVASGTKDNTGPQDLPVTYTEVKDKYIMSETLTLTDSQYTTGGGKNNAPNNIVYSWEPIVGNSFLGLSKQPSITGFLFAEDEEGSKTTTKAIDCSFNTNTKEISYSLVDSFAKIEIIIDYYHNSNIKTSEEQIEQRGPIIRNLDEASLFLGYNVHLNNKSIFINDRGFYQTPQDTDVETLRLTGRHFPEDHRDEVIIDYFVKYKTYTDTSEIPTRIIKIEDILGQWGGMFPYQTTIFDKVYKKYYYVQYRDSDDLNYDWRFEYKIKPYEAKPVENGMAIINHKGDSISVTNVTGNGKSYWAINGESDFHFESPQEAAAWLWMKDLYDVEEKDLASEKTNKVYLQYLNTWQGISLDVSPYAVVNVKYRDYNFENTMVVGRSGSLSFIEGTPVSDVTFSGRRMVQVSKSRLPYLDEWEYVLDDLLSSHMGRYIEESGGINWIEWYSNSPHETQVQVALYFNYTVEQMENAIRYKIDTNMKRIMYPFWCKAFYSSLSEIEKPHYNTVFPVAIDNVTYYYIYYIDDNWYEVSPIVEAEHGKGNSTTTIANIKEGTIVAHVPIYGYVNYRAELLRSYL